MQYKNVYITRPDSIPSVKEGRYLYGTVIGFREDGRTYLVYLMAKEQFQDDMLMLKERNAIWHLNKGLKEEMASWDNEFGQDGLENVEERKHI